MRVPALDSNSRSDFEPVVGPVAELGVESELEVEPEPEVEPGPGSDSVVHVGAGVVSRAVSVLAWADGLQRPAPRTPLHVKFVFSCVCFFGLGCVLSSLCLFLGEDELVPEQEPEQGLDLELEIMPAVSLGLLMVVVLQVLLQVELAIEVLAKAVLMAV